MRGRSEADRRAHTPEVVGSSPTPATKLNMRTKDEIIEHLTKLVLELLKIGKDKYQEVTNLLCEIEVLPKDIVLTMELTDEPITHTTKLTNVIKLEDHIIKLCPGCKKNPRPKSKKGRWLPYCNVCNAERSRLYRLNKKMRAKNG